MEEFILDDVIEIASLSSRPLYASETDNSVINVKRKAYALQK